MSRCPWCPRTATHHVEARHPDPKSAPAGMELVRAALVCTRHVDRAQTWAAYTTGPVHTHRVGGGEATTANPEVTP